MPVIFVFILPEFGLKSGSSPQARPWVLPVDKYHIFIKLTTFRREENQLKKNANTVLKFVAVGLFFRLKDHEKLEV